MENIHQLVSEQKDLIIKLRRDLHRIPETAYTEKKTSAYVIDYLKSLGLEVKTEIAQYGAVGLLKTDKPGPTVMIRADMDALPLKEDTGLDFASEHDGAMHACGHDAHMTMVLGAATIINKIKNELNGTIKFLFQPAEDCPWSNHLHHKVVTHKHSQNQAWEVFCQRSDLNPFPGHL